MTDKLRAYLDGLFEAVPNTKEVREAKDELYDGMVERYEDCLKDGMDEQAAYDCVIDSIGDISELIAELDTGEEDGPAFGTDKKSFDLNDFVKTVGNFAEKMVDGVVDWFSEPAPGEMRLVNTITLPLADVETIELAYVSDSIRLKYSDGDTLVVNEYMNRDDASLYAEVSAVGGSIRIRHGRRAGLFILRSRIEVLLPASWYGSLTLGTVSGKVQSDDSWRLASLNAKSVSGDVDFASVTASMVRLSSTSGAVRVGFAEGALELHTVTGSIRAEEVNGSGSFSTTSGGLRVGFTRLAGNVKASSVSGGVRLGIPEGTGIELDASSTTGTIHTAFNDSLNYQSRSKVHAFIGSEPFHYVKASSTSGGIHIND